MSSNIQYVGDVFHLVYTFCFNIIRTCLFQVKLDFMKLLESGILNGCKEGKVKIGLF